MLQADRQYRKGKDRWYQSGGRIDGGYCMSQMKGERKVDSQTDRRTNRRTNRQTNRQTDRQTVNRQAQAFSELVVTCDSAAYLSNGVRKEDRRSGKHGTHTQADRQADRRQTHKRLLPAGLRWSV
jgi:hypothetical protein